MAVQSIQSIQAEVSQRDLRMRSREIMDALERGSSFTITRDGHEIGELIPRRRTDRFLPREEFLALGAGLGPVDLGRFRDDLDAALETGLSDPYAH